MMGGKRLLEMCVDSLQYVQPENLINFEKLQLPSLLTLDNHTLEPFCHKFSFALGLELMSLIDRS